MCFLWWTPPNQPAHLRAVWNEAVHQGVAVVEQGLQLFGGLDRRGRSGVELLPLHRDRTAARRRHPLHLGRHLPKDGCVNRVMLLCEGGGGGAYRMTSHLSGPGVFRCEFEELIGSAPRLGQGPQHVPIGYGTEQRGAISAAGRTPGKMAEAFRTGGVPDLRPQAKRRLCCTPSRSSCRVSSAFWMWPSDSSSRFLRPREGGSRPRARRGRHSSVLPPTGVRD